MAWNETKVRAEGRFNELNSEYQQLISDSKNIERKRRPSEEIKEIKDYYNKALSLHQQGDMPNALRYMAITLNRLREQLGISRLYRNEAS